MKIFKFVLGLFLPAICATALTAQTANLQANKDVVAKFYETYGTRHDVEGCVPLFDQSAFQVVMTGMPDANIDGFKQLGLLYLRAFPDLHFKVEKLVAEGDQVAALVRFTGTQQGALMDIPATGKKVDVLSTDFWTVRNGRIVAMQSVIDNMTMMQQLGLIPAK